MNAVGIDQAVSKLAEKPFDAWRFPFASLGAFGRRAVTIRNLRSGDSNQSELGSLLQTGHILIAAPSAVSEALHALKASHVTAWSKADLTRCAEDVLLTRESHQLATIADFFDAMPDNLRAAHERNDEMREHVYIGRRFRNDTELLEMYTKATMAAPQPAKRKRASR